MMTKDHYARREKVYEGLKIGNVAVVDEYYEYYKLYNPELINEVMSGFGYTALTAAANYNQYEVCKLLIKKHKADVNQRDKFIGRRAPLHYAAGNGNTDIIKLLILNNKANIDIKNNLGWTPLIDATLNNKPEALRVLLEKNKASINAVDRWNRTALSLAAENNSIECVEVLLQYSNAANINAIDNLDRTALSYAAENDAIGCVEILLQYRADINIESDEGLLPIHFARNKNNKEIVELLERHKTQTINNHESNSNNAIAEYTIKKGRVLRAIREGDFNIVDQYFTNRPSIDEVLYDNYTALTASVDYDQYEICQLLIAKYKADINQIDRRDKSALHYAAMNGNTDIIKLLLNHNPDIELKGHFWTPLIYVAYYIAYYNKPEALKLLLDNNANVNAVDTRNRTALSLAAESNLVECVKILLEYRPDVNIKCKSGLLAIDYARQKDNKKIIALIQKYNNGNSNYQSVMSKKQPWDAIER